MKKLHLVLIVTISLIFSNTTLFANSTAAFADVPSGHWANDDIYYFAQLGIVEGTGNGSFEPDAGVTREQFAKMLVLTFKAPLQGTVIPTFSDVTTDRWSYDYIETCKQFLTGYVNPFGGLPSFHPASYATREDIAVALVRMIGLTEKDASNANYANTFSDAKDISPSILPYVSIAAERGLIKGYSDGTFKPQKGITRAEAVTLLNRATKQAITDIESELELYATIEAGSDPSEVRILIETDEGAAVAVDGKAVKMERSYAGKYIGTHLHTFTSEGNKTFRVEATKMGKKKTVEVTANYQIDSPILTIDECPETVTTNTITISGTLDDINATLTINDDSIYVGYDGKWSASFTLTEGYNSFSFVATNDAKKITVETRTIFFSTSAPVL